jgi:SAM-dependent methyltransferase
MEQRIKEAMEVLSHTISEYRATPIDLLNINDADGEYRYLLKARRSYERTIRDVITLFPKLPKEKQPIRILEIGSYLGVVSITLARLGFAVTAADLPAFMGNMRLTERYKQYGVKTIAMDLRDYAIPLSSEVFDLVIMCETLEHLNFNPLPVHAEINRVLKEEGVFYISLPNLASLVNRIKLLFGVSIFNPIEDFSAQLRNQGNMVAGIHWREYTREELLNMLNLTGFSAIRHYFFTNTESHPLARLLYNFFPILRPNQTSIAMKASDPEICFQINHFGQNMPMDKICDE